MAKPKGGVICTAGRSPLWVTESTAKDAEIHDLGRDSSPFCWSSKNVGVCVCGGRVAQKNCINKIRVYTDTNSNTNGVLDWGL